MSTIEKDISVEKQIGLIIETILKYLPAKRIYLFGSHAYGEPTVDSDIDLLAIIPNQELSIKEIRRNIIYDLSILKIYSVDLHIHYENDFEKLKMDSLFMRSIYQKGKVLYESA